MSSANRFCIQSHLPIRNALILFCFGFLLASLTRFFAGDEVNNAVDLPQKRTNIKHLEPNVNSTGSKGYDILLRLSPAADYQRQMEKRLWDCDINDIGMLLELATCNPLAPDFNGLVRIAVKRLGADVIKVIMQNIDEPVFLHEGLEQAAFLLYGAHEVETLKIINECDDPQTLGSLARGLATAISDSEDLKKAKRFLDALPSGNVRNSCIIKILSDNLTKNGGQTIDLIDELQSDSPEPIIELFANNLLLNRASSPEVLLKVGSRIADPIAKSNFAKKLGELMAERSFEAAFNSVSKLGVGEFQNDVLQSALASAFNDPDRRAQTLRFLDTTPEARHLVEIFNSKQ